MSQLAPPRTWTIALPAGMRLLSLNDRHHWSVKGRITRDLRVAAWTLARQAKIPPLAQAKVTVEYQPPPTTRRRDLDNVGPASGKPAIDGIRDAHVLEDDDTRYLTEVTYRIGEPFPKGRLVLTITEVTG
jgi:crossover junction endodeoxyribonuclease RusA